MGSEENKTIALPAATRRVLENALRERDTIQAMLQMQQERINDLVLVARDSLGVPENWSLNLQVGFVAPMDD